MTKDSNAKTIASLPGLLLEQLRATFDARGLRVQRLRINIVHGGEPGDEATKTTQTIYMNDSVQAT